MPSNLISAIHRRLGLSVTQLGVLDSLTLRLAVGQKLSRDQIYLLFDESLRRDVEAVLATYFEETEDGFIESEEVRMIERAASATTEHRPESTAALDRATVNDADTSEAEKQEEKRLKKCCR